MQIRYKIISVDRFPTLQNDIDQIYKKNNISTNPTYQMYVGHKKFVIPEDFPKAKSVIIIAKASPIVYIDFFYHGQTHTITIPPIYYDDGIKIEDIENFIKNSILKESKTQKKFEVKRAQQIFLKLLAVRSGLATYGRNNISYIKDLGSFYYLYAFLTDFIPKKYDWSDIRLMEYCKDCKICERMCPTSAIHEEEFLVDVDKCITLYNEVKGDFPEKISPTVHNSLIGCIKCQFSCPGNKISRKNTVQLESITEEETNAILKGKKDEKIVRSLTSKLKMFKYEEYDEMLPILQRNLSVLINIKK